ncbi:hypothetical protein D9611_002843 [Ephemerocybe angulata]|uniref:Fibronectin type-III domain-containing protein n=1 Tax=Ephemerocybe angulata TaxID=980116 RepID=A0A8H5C0Z7_9AGAR|nr:hypothetical protein D9611_002843 [Tulosesus angulatus]
MAASPDSFTFTVGKLDAGMAILLGDRAHLIEFPSILLPPGASTGSIVNIAVHQNHAAERKRDNEFWELQNEILDMYGREAPKNPDLQVRNVTQTSVTLEWPPIDLATAKLRSLDIYRNNQRLAAIPAPLTNTSTKVSGLDLSTDYTFQLILRTTAGTFPSNLIRVHTHSITQTSGISVCFGNVQDDVLLDNAKAALDAMGAKWSEKIQIDTTHFVCTTPAATPLGAAATGSNAGAPGVEYQRALQLSIPVVQPHWILACHSEKRMVPIASYYLGATPNTGPASASVYTTRPQSMSASSYGNIPHSAPVGGAGIRASMPPPARSPPGTSFVNNSSGAYPPSANPASRARFESTIEEAADPEAEEVGLHSGGGEDEERTPTSKDEKRKSRAGTMNKAFKFPPEASPRSSGGSPPPPVPKVVVGEEGTKDGAGSDGNWSSGSDAEEGKAKAKKKAEEAKKPAKTSIEVPPPPPVEKERSPRHSYSDDSDLGDDTVDIPL